MGCGTTYLTKTAVETTGILLFSSIGGAKHRNINGKCIASRAHSFSQFVLVFFKIALLSHLSVESKAVQITRRSRSFMKIQ
jgi:hypothetical protein